MGQQNNVCASILTISTFNFFQHVKTTFSSLIKSKILDTYLSYLNDIGRTV